MENELIIKYLRKELSQEESQKIAEWLLESRANQDFLFALEELYSLDEINRLKEAADTNNEWKKLEREILKGKSKEKKSRLHLPVFKILKYAAFIAVAISIPYLLSQTSFFKQKENKEYTFATVITEKGNRAQLILPDGTKVWLNSCSKLEYNMDFIADRKIKLSGEAYFDVAKNKDHPLTVETSLVKVAVLGTKFNLRAFEDEDIIETTLYEGAVSVNNIHDTFQQDILLHPDQQLTFNRDNTFALTSADHDNNIKWKDGIFYFKKQELRYIAKNLSRSFNVDIIITDDDLANQQFTCEFKNSETINEILDILQMTGRLDYKIINNKIELSPVKN